MAGMDALETVLADPQARAEALADPRVRRAVEAWFWGRVRGFDPVRDFLKGDMGEGEPYAHVRTEYLRFTEWCDTKGIGVPERAYQDIGDTLRAMGYAGNAKVTVSAKRTPELWAKTGHEGRLTVLAKPHVLG